MHIADQLYIAGIGVFPCYDHKGPAVKEGEDWNDYAKQPPATWRWPSHLVGVPVPVGATIIDLDTYKGVTRQHVEALLGCSLPWDEALLQRTQNGGEHYGFASPDWPVRQGSNLEKLKGFDTRVGGKGYICTGAPDYKPVGFGVFRLAQAGLLPRLPDEARAILERLERTPLEATELPTGDRDIENIVAALAYIDPSCGRSEWVKVGLALRHHFHDDEETGVRLFDAWSSGEMSNGDTPHNYVPEHIPHQWASFKPEGNTTVGSLFYEAIQGGWNPPAGIDTARAFGENAAPADSFNDLVDRIQAHGGDPKHTNDLIADVRALAGNPLQLATLLALLTRELNDAGLLTKPVREQLDALAGTATPPRISGQYAKNHTENAGLFVERHYPDGGLARSDQAWYAWTGKAWEELDDDDVKHKLSIDMASSLPQHSNIAGTYSVLCTLCHKAGKRINETPPQLVLFQNGVLDLTTGQLLAHDPGYFTTNILPYGYSPQARADRWLTFLFDIFEGDAERVALMQEWFGYMISNSYVHHKIMLMLGPRRSGKGTIGRILEQFVGHQNFTGASLHAFTSDAYLELLRTKTVAFSGDTERRVNRNSIDVVIERLKKISGNDAVTFSRKYKSTLSQTLPTRITLSGNHVPNLFDDSGALAGRLLVLPFNVSYADREDLYLYDSLVPEMEGIAAWALEGLRRLSANGRFTHPAASEIEAQYIAEAFSPLKMFIDSVCTLGEPEHKTFCGDLYSAYRAWAVNNQEAHILARKTFISAFKDATRGSGCVYGVQRVAERVDRGFRGLAVAPIDSATAGAFTPQAVQ